MLGFTIYPAIDLRRGQVVRLRQGDPRQETRLADLTYHALVLLAFRGLSPEDIRSELARRHQK